MRLANWIKEVLLCQDTADARRTSTDALFCECKLMATCLKLYYCNDLVNSIIAEYLPVHLEVSAMAGTKPSRGENNNRISGEIMN